MNDLAPRELAMSGMELLASVASPLFFALLGLGFLVGVLQAATQINDPAVGFVPRIATALGIVWALGDTMLQRFAIFFGESLASMSSVGP